jgi:hypothetical protein
MRRPCPTRGRCTMGGNVYIAIQLHIFGQRYFYLISSQAYTVGILVVCSMTLPICPARKPMGKDQVDWKQRLVVLGWIAFLTIWCKSLQCCRISRGTFVMHVPYDTGFLHWRLVEQYIITFSIFLTSKPYHTIVGLYKREICTFFSKYPP